MSGNPWYGDADSFCEDCAPDGAEEDVNHSESDSPMHCSVCGELLDAPLTSDGIKYVLDEAEEDLLNPNALKAIEHVEWSPEWVWNGGKHGEIIMAWLKMLDGYCLNKEDAERHEKYKEQLAEILKEEA